MLDDQPRHDLPTGPGLSRPVATSPDTDYTLTIDGALALYERAGHPRTPRSIQRYCAKGHLDCRLIETAIGEKYLIAADSVRKHIAYIEEVRPVTTSRDESRPVVPPVASTFQEGVPATSLPQQRPAATGEAEDTRFEPRHASTGHDLSQHVATDDRYVKLLESENEFLRGQVVTKDAQIKELTERSRETNHLVAGLQRMLAPLLGAPDPHPPEQHDHLSGQV
jgi:hypothetical protein